MSVYFPLFGRTAGARFKIANVVSIPVSFSNVTCRPRIDVKFWHQNTRHKKKERSSLLQKRVCNLKLLNDNLSVDKKFLIDSCHESDG